MKLWRFQPTGPEEGHCVPALMVLLGAAVLTGAVPAKSEVPFRIEDSIPAEAKYWDYSSIDAGGNTLYIGRMGGVLAMDLKSRKITEPLIAGNLIHAVVPLEGRIVVAADGGSNKLQVYDAAAKRLLASVPVGAHPDAAAYDARTKTVVTVNKESQDLTIVDTQRWKVVGTVKLDGDPEFAVSNGDGTLFVNIADQGRVAAVDLNAQRITGSVRMMGCEDPSGIAYLKTLKTILSVCGNGLLKFLSLPELKEVASIKVGRGADAVLIDEARERAYVPAGDDGALYVIAVHSIDTAKVVSRLKTEKGAGSGAVDAGTGRVYLPAGRRLRNVPQAKGWSPPTIAPGSFHILVIGSEPADSK